MDEPESAAPPPTGASSTSAAPAVVAESPSATPASERNWYGWQILLTAGGAHALIWGTFLVHPSVGDQPVFPIFMLGISGVALGGPIVHWAHGNVGKGFGSLGLNVGLPLVLGGAGLVAGMGSLEGAFRGLLVGAVFGTITASIVDVAVLAYEPGAPDHAESPEAEPALSLVPDIAITRDGTTLVVLSGVF